MKECSSKGLKLVKLSTIVESIGWNRWRDDGLRQSLYKYDVTAHSILYFITKKKPFFSVFCTGSKCKYGTEAGISQM
ncbi:MAG: hypothetical protein ACRYE7_01550 [Janthinobacterium lividum]